MVVGDRVDWGYLASRAAKAHAKIGYLIVIFNLQIIKMSIALNAELEQLAQEQVEQGNYSSVEALLMEALLYFLESKKRQSFSQKVSDLFDQTQSLPHLQSISDDDIAAEIEAYRSGV